MLVDLVRKVLSGDLESMNGLLDHLEEIQDSRRQECENRLIVFLVDIQQAKKDSRPDRSPDRKYGYRWSEFHGAITTMFWVELQEKELSTLIQEATEMIHPVELENRRLEQEDGRWAHPQDYEEMSGEGMTVNQARRHEADELGTVGYTGHPGVEGVAGISPSQEITHQLTEFQEQMDHLRGHDGPTGPRSGDRSTPYNPGEHEDAESEKNPSVFGKSPLRDAYQAMSAGQDLRRVVQDRLAQAALKKLDQEMMSSSDEKKEDHP